MSQPQFVKLLILFTHSQKGLPKKAECFLMLKEKYKRKAQVAMTGYPKNVKVH